jgi:ribonuclease P protein subunit POP4
MDDKKTLAREELIGLNVTIRECKDPSWIGQSGRILDETKNTFLIKIKDQKKIIAKETAIFEFEYGGKKITLDGSKIAFRPEDRIKKVR